MNKQQESLKLALGELQAGKVGNAMQILREALAEQPAQQYCKLCGDSFSNFNLEGAVCGDCAHGIEKPVLAEQPAQQPVAMRYDFDGYGYKYIDAGSGSDWQTRIKDAEPVYASPQPAQQQEYEQANPLGGPAKVFQAMAGAIRAGDDYHSVLRQYGYAEAQPQESAASEKHGCHGGDGSTAQPEHLLWYDSVPCLRCGHVCHHVPQSPPASKPLTDEQIWDEVKAADLDWQTGWSLDEDAANRYIIFARAIEAAHGIKEDA